MKTEPKVDIVPEQEAVPTVVPPTPTAPVAAEAPKFDQSRPQREKRQRPPRRRDPRTKPEFEQKLVNIRRVTRVMAGGRRFSFSVCLVAGNKKGMVGVGQGKATDTPLAIDKAFRNARKNMITINTTKNMSIPHDVEAKHAASWVKIMPARGKGISAGSSVRTVLELAGLREVGAKLLSRSKNGANNAYAAIKALQKLEHTKIVEKGNKLNKLNKE